jgi:hypothetical protein
LVLCFIFGASMLNKRSILLVVVLFPLILFAQTDKLKQNWYKGWNFGTMGGVSYFATEIKKDFSKVTMDMNSNPTGAFNFHLDKITKGNFGYGFEFGKNFFSGDKLYPTKINWLLYSSRFNYGNSHFIVHPIYYKTNVSSIFINLNYSFQNVQNANREYLNYNWYIKAGIGFSTIGVDMGYKDPNDYYSSNLPNPLYEKGQGIQSIKDMYASIHFGTGVDYYLSPRISFTAELMALFISNDYLDGIQNFEATIVPGQPTIINRMGVYSLVGELKFGISYHFNWYRKTVVNSAWEQQHEDFNNEFYYGSGPQ